MLSLLYYNCLRFYFYVVIFFVIIFMLNYICKNFNAFLFYYFSPFINYPFLSSYFSHHFLSSFPSILLFLTNIFRMKETLSRQQLCPYTSDVVIYLCKCLSIACDGCACMLLKMLGKLSAKQWCMESFWIFTILLQYQITMIKYNLTLVNIKNSSFK
jgi:hypothetical protein